MRTFLLIIFILLIFTILTSCQSSSYSEALASPVFNEGDEVVTNCRPLEDYAVCSAVVVIVEHELEKNECYPHLTYYDDSGDAYCAHQLQLIKPKKSKDKEI